MIICSDPNYTEYYSANTYVWQIGTIPAYGSGSRQLTVVVNELAEPGISMRNTATLSSSVGGYIGLVHVPVCCWDEGGIIYVNSHANGRQYRHKLGGCLYGFAKRLSPCCGQLRR
jgi:hypothetical protein